MRKDPRMLKPYERLKRTCAAGLFNGPKQVRCARINAETIRQRLAIARFVNVPILVKQDGTKAIPVSLRSARESSTK